MTVRPLVGRGAKVRVAVLAAALAEVTEVGYAALTVDNVARRAGVHKTTVYRRWADREALIIDVLAEHVATEIPVPDTGSVDGDLAALARGLVAWMTSPRGRAMTALMMSDAIRLPEVAQARQQLFASRVRQATPIVTRAVARGELPAATAPARVIESLAAPIYLRILVTSEPVDHTVADAAALIAVTAARAGLLVPLPIA
jgi:AcrR family transcriptional regulator